MYCLQDIRVQLRRPVKVGLMYCLQDLQLRWPVKIGLMYCLQVLQLRWPVKVGFMYCLQDLQLTWPVKVGLMYCLQDLQLRWPVKAVWRGRSLLTGFNISTVTNLQFPGFRQCDITPAEHHSAAADRHDITLLFFPSQTACELKMMDKIVFVIGWKGSAVV